MPDQEYTEVITRNRRYWEALAPHRPGAPVEFFRAGGSALDENEHAAIGDVRGRRVLQLACSTGDEAISLASMGARVTGVDLASAHLATARAKAAALSMDIDFRQQDMMRLDPTLTGFDLVFISWGGICWVPDIHAWARQVTERLRPGGLLVISEHHPLWDLLTAALETSE